MHYCLAVDMEDSVPKNLYSSVSVDSYQESYRMVDYLCSRGYRKIVIFTGSRGDESVGRLRLNGYRDALRDNHIEPDEKRIWYSQDWAEDVFSMANGYRLGKKLISSGIEFDCVYAVADSIAIGACKALLESGVRIPEDCGIAGFDGLLGQVECLGIVPGNSLTVAIHRGDVDQGRRSGESCRRLRRGSTHRVEALRRRGRALRAEVGLGCRIGGPGLLPRSPHLRLDRTA